MKAEIGRRIKRIRLERGFTQKELASKVGIDFTYIGKIERGEQLPSLKILLKIAETLSLPFGCFLDDRDAAVMLELVASDLRHLVMDEKMRTLLKTLPLLHKDVIPLIIETIHVLSRHRITAKKLRYESPEEAYLTAAEAEASYGKRKT